MTAQRDRLFLAALCAMFLSIAVWSGFTHYSAIPSWLLAWTGPFATLLIFIPNPDGVVVPYLITFAIEVLIILALAYGIYSIPIRAHKVLVGIALVVSWIVIAVANTFFGLPFQGV